MSDNLKRYVAIKQALRQLYPKEPQGRLGHSLNVLAMFINGIVASKSTHTRQVAKKTPVAAKVTLSLKPPWNAQVPWCEEEATGP